MAITFAPNQEEGYLLSKFSGEVTDDELLNSYKEYYENEQWIPLSKELVDSSECERPAITNDGLKRLAKYVENILLNRGITTFYTAVYAPYDLPFGISRIYEVIASESPEAVMVFRNLNDAISWIKEK